MDGGRWFETSGLRVNSETAGFAMTSTRHGRSSTTSTDQTGRLDTQRRNHDPPHRPPGHRRRKGRADASARSRGAEVGACRATKTESGRVVAMVVDRVPHGGAG